VTCGFAAGGDSNPQPAVYKTVADVHGRLSRAS
jgi:hypothetical protein